MINKLVRVWILFSVIAAGGMVTAVMIVICYGNNNAGDPNQTVQKGKVPQPNEPPIIIWYYHVHKDKPIVLETALSSGLITHAMVKTMHRKDRDYRKNAKALEAIKIAKNSDAKFIWSRPLWPLQNIKGSRAEDLFDPDYYIQEIDVLRAEANEVGADCVSLDVEAYNKVPVRKYTSGKVKLNTEEIKRLNLVMDKVVESVGKIDFVYPGGWSRRTHPFNMLGKLAKYRITEETYYNSKKRLKAVNYPYEIFGAFVNTSRKNEIYPQWPLYLIPEIFENSHLWSNKKGLFLYPKDGNALAIAKELVAYSRKLPFKAPQQQKRPDSAPK